MTLNDIAAHFNISATTVSLCLNGKAGKYGLRKELAEQIQEYAHKNGYRPNQAASILRRRRKHAPIGIAFSYESGMPRFIRTFQNIVDSLEKEGIEYVVMGQNNGRIGQLLANMRCMGVKDVLVIGMIQEPHADPFDKTDQKKKEEWEIAENLLKDGMHLYASNYAYPLPEIHCNKNFTRIGFDRPALERDILTRIHKAGLAPVAVNDGWTFQETKLISDLIESPEFILPTKISTTVFDTGLNMVPQVLKLFKTKHLRTVFLSNESIAAGLMRGLLDAGIRIPKDIGVLCFGNDAAAPFYSKQLTTLGRPAGYGPEELLQSILGKREPFPENTILDYVYHERESFQFASKKGGTKK